MKIHSTSIIDPDAKVHESVSIGPNTVIDADVVIGEGTIIDSCVRIYSGTRIGRFNKIHHCSAIGGDPQNVGFDTSIASQTLIGDNNTLREFVNVHRSSIAGEATTIANDCYLMENVIISHDSIVGNGVVMVHAAATAGHVTIEDYAFISGLTAIHQFCRIGRNSMIAGCSKIVKDVPPFVTCDGNPATVIGTNTLGLKRTGFTPAIRKKIKHVYKVIYNSKMNVTQAIAVLDQEMDTTAEVLEIINFFKESKRGVTGHR